MKYLFFITFLFLSMNLHASDDQGIKREFISMMELVSNYFQRDLSLLPEIPRDKMQSIVDAFKASLQDSHSSKLTLVDERPRDNRGIEKAAVFYLQSQRIELHRDTWIQSKPNDKAIIASLELMGLCGVDHDRYEIVVNNIFPFPDDIKKLEQTQQKLCYAAATQAVKFFANYFVMVSSCHGDGFDIPAGTTTEMKERLLRSINRCLKECAYGNNDKVLSAGWCKKNGMDEIEKDSRKYHGNLCYSKGL